MLLHCCKRCKKRYVVLLQHVTTIPLFLFIFYLVWVPEMLIDLIKLVWPYTGDQGNLYIYKICLTQLRFHKQKLTHAWHPHIPITGLHMLQWALWLHRLYLCSAERQSSLHLVPYFPSTLSVTASLLHCFSCIIASSACLVIYLCRVQGCGSLLLHPVVLNRGSVDRSVIVWTQ